MERWAAPRTALVRSRFGAGAAICLALAGVGCRDQVPKAEARAVHSAGSPRDVKLVRVTALPVERTVDVSGTLEADERILLGAKVPGRLASISVDLASKVTAGQPVAQIDPTDYQLKVEQASAAVAQLRAQLGLPPDGEDDKVDVDGTSVVRVAAATLTEAQANLARSEALAGEGLATGMALDGARATAARAESSVQSAREEVRIRQATLRQRRSELRLARQQLADAQVKSPTDGVVQLRGASVGQYLAAGATIVEIVRVDPLRLRLAVPERDATAVREGQAVNVEVDGDRSTHTGAIARVAPALDPKTRTLLVEADIPNPGTLRPGGLVRARIVVGSASSPTVPATAVVRFAGLTKVITVDGGKAKEKQITTGKVMGDRVEVVTGLANGDAVVETAGSLQQGQAVRVVEER